METIGIRSTPLRPQRGAVNIVPYGAVLTMLAPHRVPGTRGFSVVIAEETGQMSAAVVAPDGAFVISGACTTFTAASQ